MIECKVCKSALKEDIHSCPLCDYPIQGSSKQQAVFVSELVIKEGHVKDAVDRLRVARIILFFLAFFHLATPLITTFGFDSFGIITYLILGLLFAIFGVLTFKKPVIALLIPLCIILLYYALLLSIDPMYLIHGWLWKVFIIIGLGYGYASTKKSNKILKENMYLATQFGFKNSDDNDVLDANI